MSINNLTTPLLYSTIWCDARTTMIWVWHPNRVNTYAFLSYTLHKVKSVNTCAQENYKQKTKRKKNWAHVWATSSTTHIFNSYSAVWLNVPLCRISLSVFVSFDVTFMQYKIYDRNIAETFSISLFMYSWHVAA